jgi:hypothetical protein
MAAVDGQAVPTLSQILTPQMRRAAREAAAPVYGGVLHNVLHLRIKSQTRGGVAVLHH